MKSINTQSGFSLIELLVSLSIFTVVVVMSTGTLLVLIDANSKAQNMQAVMTNLTFALDSITREIRTGYSYRCMNIASAPGGVDNMSIREDCAVGGNYLSLVESGDSLTAGLSNNRIAYYYDNDFYGAAHGAILRKLSNGSWLPITSKNVQITDMEFVTTGTALSPNIDQPIVTIFIEGSAGELSETDTSFSVQTSITQRIIDI